MSPTQSPAQRSPGQFSSPLGRALFQQRIEAALLQTKETTGADGVAVSLHDGEEYVCSASVGCAPEIGVGVKPGQGICGRCISQAAIVVEQAFQGDVRSVAAVPVMKDGVVHGFVAAFSMVADAFSPDAVETLHRFAQQILKEVDPPMVIELRPKDEEESVLAQLGIDVADATNAPVSNTDEDDQYLSELLLEVLEPAPSDAATSHSGKEPLDISENHHQAPMGRSTEEVLMEIVQQTLPTPPTPPSIPPSPQNASEPVSQSGAPPKVDEITHILDAVQPDSTDSQETAVPSSALVDKNGAPPQRSMEEVLMELVEQIPPSPAVVESPGKKSIEPLARAAESAKPTKTKVEEQHPKESRSKPIPAKQDRLLASDIESQSRSQSRVFAFSIAALLVVAVGIGSFMYFRRGTVPAPQQVQAPATEIQANPQGSGGPTAPTTTPQESQPVNSEQKQKTVAPAPPRKEPQPIIVASSSLPTNPEAQPEDTPPVALTGISERPSTLQLPTKASDVTFGGQQSSGVTPAKLLNRVDPTFPQVARTMHLTGDVRMDATIGADGRVKTVSNVEGQPILAAAATEAVRKWRYESAKQNGKNVESVVQVTIRFR